MRLRLGLVVVLACAVAGADWAEAQKRFRSTYRNRDASPEQRRAALRALGETDLPEAAALLVDIWVRREKEARAIEARLAKPRGRLEAAHRDLRAGKGRVGALEERIGKPEAEIASLDARLGIVELEQAVILEALDGMRAPAVIAWLASSGMRKAESPLLLEVMARKVAGAYAGGAEQLASMLSRLRRAEQLVPILFALSGHGTGSAPAVPDAIRLLGHADPGVRMAAAYLLAAAARPEGVEPLVSRLQAEEHRSRPQRELAQALAILTGDAIGPYPKLWARWWEDHGAEVLEGKRELGKGNPSRAGKSDQGHFYGIPQKERRIIYVLDRSGSMEVSMQNPRWVDGQAVPARDDEDSRFDAAVRELLNATRRLQRGARFQVIVYSSGVEPLHTDLVEATQDEHARLENSLAHLGPEGSTNTYGALEAAFRMANVLPGQRGGAKADAIYFVSDGAPTDANGRNEDPSRVLFAVRRWNATRRVAVHTIGIGRQHSRAFMESLARQNGGEYHAILPK